MRLLQDMDLLQYLDPGPGCHPRRIQRSVIVLAVFIYLMNALFTLIPLLQQDHKNSKLN